MLIELQPARRLDKTGARFGLALEGGIIQTQFEFGGGLKPLVFFRWCPDWMPPILTRWTCLRQVGRGWEVLGVFGQGWH